MTEQVQPTHTAPKPHTGVRQALEKLIEALYWVPQTVRPGELIERVNADPATAHQVISRLGQALQAGQEALANNAQPTPAEAATDAPGDANQHQAIHLDQDQLHQLRMDAALKQLQLQSLLLSEICGAIARANPLTPEEAFALQAAHAAQTSVATAIGAVSARLSVAAKKGAGNA